jgi:hypothetical protein
MSLLSNYARQHCANWLNENAGCYLHEKISYEPIAKATAGECVLADGNTCDYFRACVLPIAPPPVQSDYMKIDTTIRLAKKAKKRPCPDCGESMKPRQRFCEKCTQKRRQKTYRQSRQNSSMSAQQLRAI